MRIELEKYMDIKLCHKCQGERLNDYARNVKVCDQGIMDISQMTIEDGFAFFKSVRIKGQKRIIEDKLLKKINSSFKFQIDVGLTYLSLNRAANTLSGGESQRIRLATQIGSALSGVLYVLDEPSIGLHQRDNDKLIETLKHLKSLGNTVIVVEHDEDAIRSADYLIDIGPGAGVHGGEVIAHGIPSQVMKSKKSITAQYLSGARKIAIPEKRTPANNDKQ